MAGRITLLGAGPGAGDLLTPRAVKLIQTAEIVLFDRLIDAATCHGIAVATAPAFVAWRGIGFGYGIPCVCWVICAFPWCEAVGEGGGNRDAPRPPVMSARSALPRRRERCHAHLRLVGTGHHPPCRTLPSKRRIIIPPIWVSQKPRQTRLQRRIWDMLLAAQAGAWFMARK